jgi:hypothetical protein
MIIDVIDTFAPLVTFVNDVTKETKPLYHIKKAINTRQRLLNYFRNHQCSAIIIKIGILARTIRNLFQNQKNFKNKNRHLAVQF